MISLGLGPSDGSNLSDFGGGWNLIFPATKEGHLKLFEVSVFVGDVTFSNFWFLCPGAAASDELRVMQVYSRSFFNLSSSCIYNSSK